MDADLLKLLPSVEELETIYKLLVVSLPVDVDQGRTPELFELLFLSCAWLTHYRALGEEDLVFKFTNICNQTAARITTSKLFVYTVACIDQLRTGSVLNDKVPSLMTIKTGIFLRKLNSKTSEPLRVLSQFLPTLFIDGVFYWCVKTGKNVDFRTLKLDWTSIVATRVEPKPAPVVNVLDFDISTDVVPEVVPTQPVEQPKAPEPIPTPAPPARLERGWRIVASYVNEGEELKLLYTITNSLLGQFSSELKETHKGFGVTRKRCLVSKESVLDPNVRGEFVDDYFVVDRSCAEKHRELLKTVKTLAQPSPLPEDAEKVPSPPPAEDQPLQKDDPKSVVTPAIVANERITEVVISSSQEDEGVWVDEEIAQPTLAVTNVPQADVQVSKPVTPSPEDKKVIMAVCK